MATDVNKSILDALEAGYGPQDIIEHLKSSEDPAHQEWYSNYSANMQTRANEQPTAAPAEPKTNTSILNAIDQANPVALGLGAAGVYAATQGPKLYNAYQDRKLDREKLAIENRRITAYEQQVGKQGLPPESIVPEQPKLSPLEEARINTERAKAEAIQSKIALEERKVAAMELKAKADAEARAAKAAAAAKQTTTASGAIDPNVKQMMTSSEVAKIDKAVDAGVKAAAKPPVAAAPIKPPSAPVQLTPTPEVLAEPAIPSGAVAPLTKEQQGMKKHLVSLYGGGTEGEKAYSKVGEILGYTPAFPPGQGGGLAPEETKVIKEWRKANIEGPKVNLTHDMKKAFKGAGGIAVLAAIPGFADAAQRKDYGAMTDIATDFAVLPFAQSREAGMPKAQEEAILASKFKESQKLGSPYRSVPPPR